MTMTQRYAGSLRRIASQIAKHARWVTQAEVIRHAATYMEDLQASKDARWNPIGTAPDDGTAVFALLNDSDIPHPVRYVDDGWEMVWDKYRLSDADGPRYWMAIPDDPDA